MDSSISPVTALDARFTSVWRVEVSTQDVTAKPDQKTPAAQAADKGQEETKQQSLAELEPGVLLIRVDVDAGRFVNTLLDPRSEEVIRQYPSEAQLAYSRAVNAYLRALK